MTISITTDHFLFEDGSLTIRAFGYELSWLGSCVTENDGRYTFEREPLIERMSDGRTWHWTKKHGRWTTFRDGEDRDGWV